MVNIKEENNRLVFDYSLLNEKSWIIGLDEVGYGCFSGSLVVGAVGLNLKKLETLFPDQKQLFKSFPNLLKVKDSKKTQSKNRILVREDILKLSEAYQVIYYSYGEATVDEINTLGMAKAHDLATQRALISLKEKCFTNREAESYFIIIDGNKIDKCLQFEPVNCIIQADDKSFAVACASILAKEFRDEQISLLAKEYPQYHWDKNKGYGTPDHRAALKEHGMSPHHRLKYCRNHL